MSRSRCLPQLACAGLLSIFLLGGNSPAQEFSAAPAAGAFTPPPDTPVIPWLRFSIQYAVRILGSDGPSKIVFYITSDGGATWKLLGEDPDKQSPMMVTVPGEGTYGFATVVASGNRPAVAPRPGTRPDKFVIVDRTPPAVTWISPANGNVKATEDGVLLEWAAHDPHMGATPVSIEYSTDGGTLWLPIRQNLPAKGSINWKVPPMAGDNLQLRLTAKDLAGNTRIARNQTKIAVDRTPPTVRITAPDNSGQKEFDVYFEAEDESGIATAELYYTSDNGNTWAFASSAANSPIHFAQPVIGSAVGLYLAATDKAGNRTPAPQAGTAPMKVVALDNEKPQVNFLAPFNATGTTLEVKKPANIAWNTIEANPEENSGVLEYSTDGGQTWYFIAEHQPVSGSFTWTPATTEANVLLRLTVTDKFGNKGAALSQTFSVDSGRPSTRITDVTPVTGAGNIPPAATGNLGDDLTVPSIPSPADVLTGSDEKIGSLDDNKAFENLPEPGKTPAAATTPASDGMPVIPMPTENGIGKAEKENNEAARAPEPVKSEPAKGDSESKKDEKDPFADFGNIPPIGADISQTPPALTPPDSKPAEGLKTIDAVLDNPGALEKKIENGKTPDAAAPLALPNIPSPAAKSSAIPEPGNLPVPAATPAFDTAAALAQANAALSLPNNEGLEKAEKVAQEIITNDPNNAAPYAVMAQVRTKQNKFSEAVNFANSACRLAPNDYNYLEILGYAEYAHANSLFTALRSGQVPDSKQQAVSADMVKSLNASETTYLSLLKSPDKSKVKTAYFRLGHIDYFRGTKVLTDDSQWTESIRKAIDNYQKAGKINEPVYREVLQVGICNYRLRDYDHAERWLERSIEVAANDHISPKEAYYYLASIHEKLDRPQQALEYWEKVVKEYPESNQFHKIAVEHVAEIKANSQK